MMSREQKVVVTGVGGVTSLGNDIATSWKRLLACESAAAPVKHFETSQCRCQTAATVNVEALDFKDVKKSHRLSRAGKLALMGAREALQDANLLDSHGKCREKWLPMSVSCTAGGMSFGQEFISDLHGKLPSTRGTRGKLTKISRYQPQQQTLDLHEHFHFRGPTTILANACASGANSIGHAADLIRHGKYECVLAGGWEEISEILFVGFDSLHALTTECCRPFDVNRSGLILGEASGFLVLESESHAKKRHARILCEISGYGHSIDMHHLTQPNPTGDALVQAMHAALSRSGISTNEIGYLNAHGTATPLNDASECAAFNRVFGDRLPQVRVSSTKAAIGHTLGAAGSIEAVLCIKALTTGDLPPQINLRTPEPLMKESLVHEGERLKSKAVMSTNLGFGGSNAALIFSTYGI